MIEAKTEFHGQKIQAKANKGGLAGLYKSAASLMRVARQKIRFRKNKSSIPGQPPFQHSKGGNSFKHTIQFAIDKENLTAYIGPQKVSDRRGKDVPRTLEFGGMTSPSANPNWYQVNNVPEGMNNVSAIASWLLKQGYGPIFMAGSESGVINQAAAGRARYSRARISAERKVNSNHKLFQYIRRRKIKGTNKTVFYMPFPIKTFRQARRAAENIVQYYGMPTIKPRHIAPRPFMAPTLSESKNSLAKYFAKTF